MNIANIDVTRVITHEVVRTSQMNERPPVLSDELVELDERGKELVGKRLITTLASGSHCVDVTVEDATQGTPFNYASAMLDLPDPDFVQRSQQLATSLSLAQTAGPIRSGSAIFVQGTCNVETLHCRFMSIIKADSDQGFYRQVGERRITLRYVHDMLLSESQRLIKVAFILEEMRPSLPSDRAEHRSPEDFSVKIFDHMMQNSGDRDAAMYFYQTFMRCRLADSASRKTKQFYEVARVFISEMEVTQAEKVEFHGDLVAYMRSNRAILEPRAFAQDVLPEANQDSFVGACRDSGITEAFTKDVQLVRSKLRRQSYKFTSNVTIYAPSETFRDSVRILEQSDDGWTNVKIRGSIESMP